VIAYWKHCSYNVILVEEMSARRLPIFASTWRMAQVQGGLGVPFPSDPGLGAIIGSPPFEHEDGSLFPSGRGARYRRGLDALHVPRIAMHGH